MYKKKIIKFSNRNRRKVHLIRKTRTSQQEKLSNSTWSYKDIISITLAILAIAISFGTAYFNIIRTEENMIAITNDVIPATIASDGNLHVKPGDEGEVIFINSGNRPVVVHRIVISYMQPIQGVDPECLETGGFHFETSFKSTIIKPNDVILSRMSITDPMKFSVTDEISKRREDGAFIFPPAVSNALKKEILMDVCINFYISTPSESYFVTSVPVFRYTTQSEGYSYSLFDIDRYFGKPAVLIRRMGTVFGG